MSHENAKTSHRQESKLSTESISDGCTIVVGKSRNPKVSSRRSKEELQKRKEEATQSLYLNRV